jgi:hypothetical protein
VQPLLMIQILEKDAMIILDEINVAHRFHCRQSWYLHPMQTNVERGGYWEQSVSIYWNPRDHEHDNHAHCFLVFSRGTQLGNALQLIAGFEPALRVRGYQSRISMHADFFTQNVSIHWF